MTYFIWALPRKLLHPPLPPHSIGYCGHFISEKVPQTIWTRVENCPPCLAFRGANAPYLNRSQIWTNNLLLIAVVENFFCELGFTTSALYVPCPAFREASTPCFNRSPVHWIWCVDSLHSRLSEKLSAAANHHLLFLEHTCSELPVPRLTIETLVFWNGLYT